MREGEVSRVEFSSSFRGKPSKEREGANCVSLVLFSPSFLSLSLSPRILFFLTAESTSHAMSILAAASASAAAPAAAVRAQ